MSHSPVKPKKHFGQHFLTDESIAMDIADALTGHGGYARVCEIGPGTGMLTKYLLPKPYALTAVEIDREAAAYMRVHYPAVQLLEGDILQADPEELRGQTFALTGNFPYNISSQILFWALDRKDNIPEIVCMLQKEVAQRIASPPGNKDYGILSVLLQAYYDIEYLFTVQEHVFNPPPKVKSGVIRLKRNTTAKLPCDEKLFKTIVKQAFQMRRKTLRNALKGLNLPISAPLLPLLDKRAEQLGVDDFVALTLSAQQDAI